MLCLSFYKKKKKKKQAPKGDVIWGLNNSLTSVLLLFDFPNLKLTWGNSPRDVICPSASQDQLGEMRPDVGLTAPHQRLLFLKGDGTRGPGVQSSGWVTDEKQAPFGHFMFLGLGELMPAHGNWSLCCVPTLFNSW